MTWGYVSDSAFRRPSTNLLGHILTELSPNEWCTSLRVEPEARGRVLGSAPPGQRSRTSDKQVCAGQMVLFKKVSAVASGCHRRRREGPARLKVVFGLRSGQ